MSIIIKEMDKPKGCYYSAECDSDCLYLNRRDVCMFQNDEFEYFPIENEFNWRDEKRGKAMYKNCPLIQIPEGHGRLIDADALIKDLRYDIDMDRTRWITDKDEISRYDEECKENLISILESACTPIVLEAEE